MDAKIKERLKAILTDLEAVDEGKYEVFKSFLLGWVKDHTNYFTAPCSTKYHLNCEGGLLEHSINVTELMLKLKEQLAPDISVESCIICGMLHDLGKAGDKDVPYYIENTPTPNQIKYGYSAYPPYIVNPDLKPYMEHSDRSVFNILKYSKILLTPEEYQAIRIHDGLYVDNNKTYAMKESKLAMLLHIADIWSSSFIEPIIIADWRK